MPPYDPGPEIIEASSRELNKIVSLLRDRGGDPAGENVILIGGWAVDVYNPYFGSVDIDLVTNKATSQLLIDHLTANEDYLPRISFPSDTVYKVTPYGEIILDLIPRSIPYGFEGHPEVEFSWEILSGNTVFRIVRGGAGILIPNRSVLVLLKIKAAWDRTYRILQQTSKDISYDGRKRLKDCSDIIALIDPTRGGREIDLEILGRQISRAAFLKDIILRIPDLDAVQRRYQMMTQAEIRSVCENFVSVL